MKKISKKEAERLEKNDAMQFLLNVSKKMRERGLKPNDIDARLKPALISYKRGRYEQAKDYIFTCIAI